MTSFIDPLDSSLDFLVLLLSSSVESVAMPSITDLPVELFLDNLLPLLPTSDLAHLAATCKVLDPHRLYIPPKS